MIAWPVLSLWITSPFIAWWLSRRLPDKEAALSADQAVFLHAVARRTWAFFETFVGPEDNWLPPDNFQENPGPILAHRTSPTKYVFAAGQPVRLRFRYLTADGLIARTGRTFDTMDLLECSRGHFFNWYDTQTLTPLIPQYVSTVDSSNLSARLLTLKAGLLALPDSPVIGVRAFAGLRDTLAVLNEVIPDDAPPSLLDLGKNSTRHRSA